MTIAPTETIPLGNSDLHVSPLGLGAWQWGDKVFWGFGQDYNDSDIRAAFDTSVQAGINFIDTAELYGRGYSEKLLGQFIKDTDTRLVITTKFLPLPWRLTRKQLIGALKQSLRRLQLDQVDLYLIHQPWPPVSIRTWMNGLADAVEQGLCQLVGVSNFDVNQMRTAHVVLADRNIPLSVNQVHYSLLHRHPERSGLLSLCQELKITLVAYSPLEMGLLTGKYTSQNPPPGLRGRRYGKKLDHITPLINLLREIGEAHCIEGEARTPGQVAINWVLCKGTIAIPGAKNAHQAAQNAGAMGWRLTADEVAALDQASTTINI